MHTLKLKRCNKLYFIHLVIYTYIEKLKCIIKVYNQSFKMNNLLNKLDRRFQITRLNKKIPIISTESYPYFQATPSKQCDEAKCITSDYCPYDEEFPRIEFIKYPPSAPSSKQCDVLQHPLLQNEIQLISKFPSIYCYGIRISVVDLENFCYFHNQPIQMIEHVYDNEYIQRFLPNGFLIIQNNEGDCFLIHHKYKLDSFPVAPKITKKNLKHLTKLIKKLGTVTCKLRPLHIQLSDYDYLDDIRAYTCN